MSINDYAHRAGASLPDSATQRAAHALLRIDGESYAAAWLDRLRAGSADPGELAVILSFLHGEMLAGACRVIEKALEVRHG